MTKKQSILLFGKNIEPETIEIYATIAQQVLARDCDVLVLPELFAILSQHEIFSSIRITRFDGQPAVSGAVAMLCVGGDGTFLEAARMTLGTDIPLMGINRGRLGFLADVAPEQISEALDMLFSGRFRLATLDVLSLYVNDSRESVDYAVNEFAVTKCDNASMLTIHAYVDGEFLTTYWADGLIVATAAGSTAYSLSVGGPIVSPQAANLVITPVAPHNLSLRPLVLPSSSVIQLRVEGRGTSILTSLDGRNHIMDSGCQLRIAKTPMGVKVVQLTNHSFFAALREKLKWGADARN